jgi:hypothetical protein
MDNNTRLSNSECARSKEDLYISNMTNHWKMMFDEFFAHPDNSPPISRSTSTRDPNSGEHVQKSWSNHLPQALSIIKQSCSARMRCQEKQEEMSYISWRALERAQEGAQAG